MIFLSSRELAEKWGVDQSFVLRLAREGRIEGARLLGKSWMFPENAKRPEDGRKKGNRPKGDFRFPLFVNFKESAYFPALSEEEVCLREAQLAFQACRFVQARELLRPLCRNTKNPYIRLAALYYLLYIAKYDNSPAYDAVLMEMNAELKESFPYRREMLLLRYGFEADNTRYRSVLEDFFVEPEYVYHPSAYYVAVLVSFLPIQNGDFALMSKLRYETYELLCQQMEREGYLLEAQKLHNLLSVVYQLQNDDRKMKLHIRQGLTIAMQNDFCFSAVLYAGWYPKVTQKVLEEFPKEFAEKIMSTAKSLWEKWSRFESRRQNASYLSVLSATELAYAYLANQGFTNREIAAKHHVSEKTVSKIYREIYEKLGVDNKKELAELINSAHKEYRLYLQAKRSIIGKKKEGGAMYQPLAELLRPESLDEVFGQEHILAEGAVLRRLVDSGNVPNMIFYGPSGTGKTTVANIIAKQTNRTLFKLNATTASTADIKEIVSQLDTMMAPNGVLLYLDEIQSFNKKQQQSLLEHIENGKITLIASTTENPYFYVFNAILSRSTVFEFKQISAEAALKAVNRAVAHMEKRAGLTAVPEPGALEYIAGACGGDLRKALNAVEVLFSAGIAQGDTLPLTLKDAQAVAQKSAIRADRDGDNYYDLLSALQKSIRGSDPDAAVHYLARLLEAGQMQSAIRRLMVTACEDIGLAYPMIIPIVKACVDAALMLGMPEARIPLGDAAVLMATAPKSNSAHIAYDAAAEDVRKGKGGDFPRHLQNMHADTYTQERDQGYRYPHNYPNHWIAQQYLPDELKDAHYYEFGANKVEQAAKQYWEAVKGK